MNHKSTLLINKQRFKDHQITKSLIASVQASARLIENETGVKNNPGSDLLSHTPAHAVPSAVAGLTSVFGMGTGVTLPL